jgi:hypothetical protein
MGPPDVLKAQLDSLRQELVRAKRSSDSADLESALRIRVAARFDTELTRLEKRAETFSSLLGSAGQPMDAQWRELRKLQTDAGTVLNECLAFVQGALARRVGVDNGICALTDALLDDLAAKSDIPWGRFTLLATSEFYRETADIIRIRYPDVSLWSMPFAAHEFGHFLGPALRRSRDGAYVYPFQDLLKLADERSKPEGQLHTTQWHHSQELFADLFATYSLGPAYAAAIILLRMNPAEAHAESYSHPSGASRVHGILWALDRMSERDDGTRRRPFRDVTDLLSNLWQESMGQAKQSIKLPDAQASLLTQRLSELFDLLADATPERLMFKGADWNRVEALANDMLAVLADDATDRGMTDLSAAATCRDVLNAAWLTRLNVADQNPRVLNDLAQRALVTFRRVAAGSDDGGL